MRTDALLRQHAESQVRSKWTTYYGTELTSNHFDVWSHFHGINIDSIRPGKPVDNAHSPQKIPVINDIVGGNNIHS